MRDRLKKVLSVICIILSVLCAIGTILFGILIAGQDAVDEGATELTASQSLYLMQRASDVYILEDIFGVYDENSLAKIRNSGKISDKVKEEFLGSTYTGNYEREPDVEVSKPMYNPSASSLVARYYTTVTITYENRVKSYNMIVEFVEGKLISIEVIP